MIAEYPNTEAARNVEQADQCECGRRNVGRQAAQRYFAWQVGGQERDMKAAGEETEVQAPVTAIAGSAT